MYIVALIPARKGSKRIPNKNMKLYAGHPLIYWSIKVAKASKYINEVIITTDCSDIAVYCVKQGASVPFVRPSIISQDLSTDHEFIEHYINWAYDNNKMPDLIVQLRPTYPNRKVNIVDDCIQQFINNSHYHSLRTVCLNDKPAYKMYNIYGDVLVPLFNKVSNITEPYNQPAQLLPKTYWHNGYVDIIKPSIVITKGSITGSLIYPYVMDSKEINDIDTEEDWLLSESKFLNLIN